MKNLKRSLFLFIFLIHAQYSISYSEQSYQGIVCLKFDMCNYMMLYLNNGNYTIAEDIDSVCTEGDTLVAQLKTLGEMQAQNISKNTTCKIKVELWDYSKVTTMQQLIKICKSNK